MHYLVGLVDLLIFSPDGVWKEARSSEIRGDRLDFRISNKLVSPGDIRPGVAIHRPAHGFALVYASDTYQPIRPIPIENPPGRKGIEGSFVIESKVFAIDTDAFAITSIIESRVFAIDTDAFAITSIIESKVFAIDTDAFAITSVIESKVFAIDTDAFAITSIIACKVFAINMDTFAIISDIELGQNNFVIRVALS